MEGKSSRRVKVVKFATLGAGLCLLVSGTFTPSVAVGFGGGGGFGGEFYKGSEALDLVAVAPNPARCGDFPNFEAQFEGQGIDTAGGIFDVTASGCQNIQTGKVFDLVAVDTYADGSTVTIEASTFFFQFDPSTCVSTNALPVPYEIADGTGQFATVTGGGFFNIANNDPSCNGEIAPGFVWFGGVFDVD